MKPSDIKILQAKQNELIPKNRHRIFDEIYLGGMPEYWIKKPDRDKKEVDLIYVKDQTLYPIEIKKGIGKDKADKNFKILEQYKMPIETGLIIDTSDKVFPLSRNAYYCPVGMIGL